MMMSRRGPWPGTLVIVQAGILAGAQGGRVESGGPPPSEAPAALQAALEPTGLRLARESGVLGELWLARALDGLAEGQLVGAVRLDVEGRDVRDRTIQPGLYTLRYASLPPEERHRSCQRRPDFVLLMRAADDPDPTVRLTFHEMTEASARIADRRHPVVWQMEWGGQAPTFPTLAANEDGRDVLTLVALREGSPTSLSIHLGGPSPRRGRGQPQVPGRSGQVTPRPDQ